MTLPIRMYWRCLVTNNRYLPDIVTLLVLCSIVLMLAQVAYRSPRSAGYTLTAPEVLLPHTGLYDPERLPDQSRIYRWTSETSRIDLPNPGGRPVVHLLLAAGPRPVVPLQVQVAGEHFSLQLTSVLRSYALLLPSPPGERVSLTLSAPALEADGRTLGVIVSNMAIAGGGAAPIGVLLALGLATVAGYTLLRQAGGTLRLTALVILLLHMVVLGWQAASGWRYGLLTPLCLLAALSSIGAMLMVRWFPPNPFAHPVDLRMVPLTRNDAAVILLLLIIALSIRWPWLHAPDPVGDLELAARRMWFLHDYGLAGSYMYGGDYVPFRLYLLWGLSQLVRPFGGGFFDPLPAVTLTLIKLPALLADLAAVIVIYVASRRWQPVYQATLIAALYSLSPPVWMNVAWWGQVDTLLMLPLLGTVVLLDRDSGRWSWLCWGTALLIKPQAIILTPLLFVATLRRHGLQGLVQGAMLAGGLLVLAVTPLALAGQGPGLLEAYIGSVGRFPHLTNGAYNVWYLLTLWVGDADSAIAIGGLSYRALGMLLLSGFTLLVVVTLLYRYDRPARIQGAAVLALAFFMLPTQIHGRYLFLTLAFLALGIAAYPWLRWPYMALMLTATINILGTLDGFVPIATAWIRGSPLPVLCVLVNLGVLLALSAQLLITSRIRPEIPTTLAGTKPLVVVNVEEQ